MHIFSDYDIILRRKKTEKLYFNIGR